MVPSGEVRRSRSRLFVSGISLLGFGVSLVSVGLIAGCDDGKSKMTQIENVNPAEKAKDSMNYYQNKTKKGGSDSAKK